MWLDSKEGRMTDKDLETIGRLRCTFAASALQGLLASPDTLPRNVTEGQGPQYLSELAVIYADALIKALNNKE